jgi:cytochrome c
MQTKHIALCVSLFFSAGIAHAAPDPAKVQDILSKNGCLACHAVDKKVLGPAYNEIAAKHKSDPNAAALLTKHIREGSTGVWGPIPMPPHPNMSDEDIKTVVEWVLAGAPQ